MSEFSLSEETSAPVDEVSHPRARVALNCRVCSNPVSEGGCSATTCANRDPDDEDDEVDPQEKLPPASRIVIPAEVTEIDENDDIIYILGTRGRKVTKIFGLEGMPNLKELILRSCLIASMQGVETLVTLRKLELYDNQIERITHIERLSQLTILDISFNAIREMAPVAHCPLLEELYIAQNKLRRIEGLVGLTRLRILDLGANRIRRIEGLDSLVSLESLWLGKNKIEEINGLDSLQRLRQLDIQNNRLTSLGVGLVHLTCLEELYLACNAIERLDTGLPVHSPLGTLDLSTNRITSTEGLQQMTSLKELWMTASLLHSLDSLHPLTHLSLDTLYLERSPVSSTPDYRDRVLELLPTLTEFDANEVVRR